MNSRRTFLSTLAAVVSCAGLLTLGVCSGPAFAAGTLPERTTHKFLRQLPGFGRVVALAVSAGGLLVADHGKDVVVRVSSSTGVPAPFECSVECEKYISGDQLTGTPGGAFAEVSGGVAVDEATGEIYVSEGPAVDVFASTGKYLGQITEVPVSSGAAVTGRFSQTAGLTFDQETGELYVAVEGDREKSLADVVDVFKAEAVGGAKYTRQFGAGNLDDDGGRDQSVGVSEAGVGVEAGTMYVATGTDVDVFDASGSLEASWTGAKTVAGSLGSEYNLGVGLDPASGRVYVGATGERVVDEMPSSVAEGEPLGRLTGTPEEPFTTPFTARPLAVVVGRSGGDVFVGDEGVVDVFGPDLGLPGVENKAATEVKPRKATFHGKVSTIGETEPAGCVFVWGVTSEAAQKVACEPPEVPAESEEAVEATVSGLLPDTTYSYTVQATNGHGTNTGEGLAPGRFTTPGPGVRDESVSDVSSTSASLGASIDPHNGPASLSRGARESYYFQYSTGSVGGCTPSSCASVPVPPGETLGESEVPVAVQAHLQGLSTATLYHFRVVAVSEASAGVVEEFPAEVFSFAEGSFTTQGQGSFALADGREWEMVSPPGKEGALIQGPGEPWGMTQAADTGDAFTFMTNVPSEKGVAGYANSMQVLAERGPAGWSDKDLASPHNGAVSVSDEAGQEYRLFNEELTEGIIQPFGPFQPCENGHGEPQSCFSTHASEQTSFVHDLTTGEYVPVATGCPGKGQPCPLPVQEYADVSEGTVFGQKGPEEGNPCPPEKFCAPFVVGASPDGEHVVVHADVALKSDPAPEECNGGLYEWNAEAAPASQLQRVSVLPENGGFVCQASLGTFHTVTFAGADASHAVSDDGSRVFWTDGNEELFMRDVPREATVQVGGVGARFQTASSDGSRVFFTENSGLYECEIGEALECNPVLLATEPGGNVGVDGASEDGSYVYYDAAGGLYVDHLEGDKWTPTFIAHEQGARSRVSPDGRWLAFLSKEQLTGYDNRDASSGQPDEEAYLYDAESGRLTCASCDPTGARPVGTPEEQAGLVVGGGSPSPSARWLSAELPLEDFMNSEALRYQPRYLSDSGRLFFESDDALVPKDINGTWDVYEYEPEGIPAGEHACTASSASGSVVYKPARVFEAQGHTGEEGAGCVGLISSGESQEESVFLDASETGADVFFMTTSQLSTRDFDKSYDIYDAHECTAASPCVPEPAAALPECVTAEACRAAPMPEPSIYGAPPSATFNGLGNLSPAPQVAAKPVVKTKALTRAQKLAAALKACKKDRKKAKRAKCVRHARKEYGQSKKAKK